MCGHGALAAALGVQVAAVRSYFSKGGWVNIPIMQAAIKAAGRTSTVVTKETFVAKQLYKGMSVILVEWRGPWQSDRYERCRHRHWVTSNHRLIWDSNLEQWASMETWAAFVPELYPEKATGFDFFRAVVLNPK